MKKKLEADLISIAHRILKIKNKSDIVVLHQETQKLYEKLSVLRFVEENFADAKPTIGQSEIIEKLDTGFDYKEFAEPIQSDAQVIATGTMENHVESFTTAQAESVVDSEPETSVPNIDEVDSEDDEMDSKDVQAEIEQTGEEPELAETSEVEESETPETEEITPEEPLEIQPIQDKSRFNPAFELTFEAKSEDTVKPVAPQFSFDDLLGKDYADPIFVKPEDLHKHRDIVPTETGPSYAGQPAVTSEKEFKPVSLNDRLNKGIIIGLNDRIAFMQHLFNNSSEDYNRVLSQLITFDTFDEAQSFIDDMVKPDYNNWNGKEEYSQRFLEIIEKRFS